MKIYGSQFDDMHSFPSYINPNGKFK